MLEKFHLISQFIRDKKAVIEKSDFLKISFKVAFGNKHSNSYLVYLLTEKYFFLSEDFLQLSNTDEATASNSHPLSSLFQGKYFLLTSSHLKFGEHDGVPQLLFYIESSYLLRPS